MLPSTPKKIKTTVVPPPKNMQLPTVAPLPTIPSLPALPALPKFTIPSVPNVP